MTAMRAPAKPEQRRMCRRAAFALDGRGSQPPFARFLGGESEREAEPPVELPRRRSTMWLEMKVKQLALDPLSNMPMIILRDEEEKRALPIWVGLPEANAIALELEKIPTARPMTHDLIKNILESVDARVAKVVVNDLRDNTFFAVIHLRLGSKDLAVDSRPSDAIALALRVDAPIFVDEEVLTKAESVEVKVVKDPESPGKADDPARIKEWLESIKPGDFDKIDRGKDPDRPDD
jgi:bifunctional DNase/RNase